MQTPLARSAKSPPTQAAPDGMWLPSNMASMPYDQWSVEEVPAFCESVSQPSQVPGKTVLSGRIVRSTKEKPQTQKDSGASMVSMRRVRYELENTNISGDGALDCLVKLLSLDCVSTFEGASGSGHIEATGGYATQFGTEVALLDFPWFFTTLVAHGERNAKDSTPLSAVTIAFDAQTPDTLVTGRVLGAKARRLLTWLS